MRNRLAAVAMTYWTRPFVQLFGGLSLLLLVMVILMNDGSPLAVGHAFFYQGIGLLFLLLGFHATSQFTQYASRLTPGFDRPHQVVAVIITLGMTAMGSALGFVQGYSPLHCLSLLVTVAAVFVWFGFMMASQGRRPLRPHTSIQKWIGGVGGAVIGGGAFIPLLFSQQLEMFLNGSPGPLPALLLIAISMVAIVQWVAVLPAEAERFAASNATTAFTWKDHQQRMVRLTKAVDGQPLPQWGYGASDTYLEKTLSVHRSRMWDSVRLRRAGTTRTFRTVLMFAICLPVLSWFMSEVVLSLTDLSDRRRSPVGSMSWLWVVMFMMVAAQSVGGVWRQRMTSMTTESLWPTTRSRLRLEMFLSVLIDFAPIVVSSLFYGLVLIMFRFPEEADETLNPAMLCGWLLLNTSLYAFVMWALTQRSTTTIWAGAVLYYIAGSVVTMGYIMASLKQGVVTVGLVLGTTSALMCVIAMGTLYAWKQWRTVEFGMFDQ